MFNRALQVKMVKNEKNKTNESTIPETPFEEKVAVIDLHLGKVVEKLGKAIILYVLVDTIRQVAIENAKK